MRYWIANGSVHTAITPEAIKTDILVENGKMMEVEPLKDYTVNELKNIAKQKGIKGYTKMTKEELLDVLDKE